jgi:putative intracellular protease/amidase
LQNTKTPSPLLSRSLELIDAGIVKGRRLTSYESLRTDLKNAGANWVDEEVVVDDYLVTSRKREALNQMQVPFILDPSLFRGAALAK